MREDPHAPQRLTHDDFAALVARHQHPLHAYLAGLVGQGEQAFDLVQETFYDAWRAAQKGAAPFLVGAAELDVRRWLFRAGSNNALSLLRRRRLIRWESLDAVTETCAPDPSGYAGGFEERFAESQALQAALAQLAPQDAACLLLRIVHGFSAAETGEILTTSAENVNTRLARAKQRLRAVYAQQQTPWEERTSR